MTSLEALQKWEVLNQKRQHTDGFRDYYQRVAMLESENREWAEKKCDELTEEMHHLCRAMDELEAEFADALHHAAEIVNGWALVMGWREW